MPEWHLILTPLSLSDQQVAYHRYQRRNHRVRDLRDRMLVGRAARRLFLYRRHRIDGAGDRLHALPACNDANPLCDDCGAGIGDRLPADRLEILFFSLIVVVDYS